MERPSDATVPAFLQFCVGLLAILQFLSSYGAAGLCYYECTVKK